MEIFGAVLAYQGFIFFTILLTGIFNKAWLGFVCILWTIFTLVNLFFPPLIIVQLIVIWGTYKMLHGEEIVGSTSSIDMDQREKERLAFREEQLVASRKRMEDYLRRK